MSQTLKKWAAEEKKLARAERISSVSRGLLTEDEASLYASGRLITLRRLRAKMKKADE